jgi:hypothetical protein
MRKEAMDEIEAALKSCSGLIETTPPQMKQLAELTRALRDRLTDTQINLRPTAARLAGSLLSVVEKGCQAKLGKLVFAPLINAAMNDIKKPMRDASLAAIRTGITASSLDGGDLNELALESLVSALVAEVNESSIRVRSMTFNRAALQLFYTCFHSPGMSLVSGWRIAGCVAFAAFSRR